MSDTEWFERKPDSDVAQGTNDPSLLLIGDSVPDWVRLPNELGGQQVRVARAFIAPCPQHGHDVRHLELEGTDIRVAESHQYYWYRPKPPSEPKSSE